MASVRSVRTDESGISRSSTPEKGSASRRVHGLPVPITVKDTPFWYKSSYGSLPPLLAGEIREYLTSVVDIDRAMSTLQITENEVMSIAEVAGTAICRASEGAQELTAPRTIVA